MRINLKIAGKPYPAYITPDQEEAFRQAEHNVNDYVAKLRKRNVEEWSDLDYLALTALRFSIDKVMLQIDNEETRRLESLEGEIFNYLNDLKK